MNSNILSAFDKERHHQARQVRIQFSFINLEDDPVTETISAAKLRKDWHGDCIHCPPNDAALTALCIGRVSIPNDQLAGFTFEDLMDLIEGTWNFKRGPKSKRSASIPM